LATFNLPPEEKPADEVEWLKEYLVQESRGLPIRRKFYVGIEFHLRQRPWFVICIPIVILGNLFLPIDVGPVLGSTIGGLIASLSLTLTSVLLLRSHYRLMPSEIQSLHDTAAELQISTQQVRDSIREKYSDQKGIQSILARKLPSPPDVESEYDVPRLLAYASAIHTYISSMLFLPFTREKTEESVELRRLWEKGLNFILRMSASSGFLDVVAGPIDFVTVTAPTAIFSGILLLSLSSGPMRDSYWYVLLKIVYWLFLIATIVEVALIVRRATRFAISAVPEGAPAKGTRGP
jgi:hypothetical protein